jgi:hypothetical protein
VAGHENQAVMRSVLSLPKPMQHYLRQGLVRPPEREISVENNASVGHS